MNTVLFRKKLFSLNIYISKQKQLFGHKTGSTVKCSLIFLQPLFECFSKFKTKVFIHLDYIFRCVLAINWQTACTTIFSIPFRMINRWIFTSNSFTFAWIDYWLYIFKKQQQSWSMVSVKILPMLWYILYLSHWYVSHLLRTPWVRLRYLKRS